MAEGLSTHAFQLAPQHFAAFSWWVRRRNVLRWVLLCILPLPTLVVLALWFRAATLGWGEALGRVVREPAGEIGLILAIVYPIVQIVGPFTLGSAQARASKALGPRTVSISSTGLHEQLGVGSKQYDWSAFKQIGEHRDVMVFPLGPSPALTGAILVPRSAFPSPAEADAFVAEARRLWQAARAKPAP